MAVRQRCRWLNTDPLYIRYHDEEWGRPVHDDRRLFECLILEGAQAGLSWYTVLKKRENYRRLFKDFDPKKVAKFTPANLEKILKDPGIIRHRGKIESTVTNAKAFLAVQKEFGTFDRFIWQFAGTKDAKNASAQMSSELKKRGFRFVGSTICYAFMQACGLVNDHEKQCFLARLERATKQTLTD